MLHQVGELELSHLRHVESFCTERVLQVLRGLHGSMAARMSWTRLHSKIQEANFSLAQTSSGLPDFVEAHQVKLESLGPSLASAG